MINWSVKRARQISLLEPIPKQSAPLFAATAGL